MTRMTFKLGVSSHASCSVVYSRIAYNSILVTIPSLLQFYISDTDFSTLCKSICDLLHQIESEVYF